MVKYKHARHRKERLVIPNSGYNIERSSNSNARNKDKTEPLKLFEPIKRGPKVIFFFPFFLSFSSVLDIHVYLYAGLWNMSVINQKTTWV